MPLHDVKVKLYMLRFVRLLRSQIPKVLNRFEVIAANYPLVLDLVPCVGSIGFAVRAV